MGLIDADELVQRILSQTIFDDKCADLMDAILRLIHNAPTKKQWISVEDRLPENEGKYLTRYLIGRNEKAYYAVLSYFAYDKVPQFQRGSGNMKITHWMPLPEAPNV